MTRTKYRIKRTETLGGDVLFIAQKGIKIDLLTFLVLVFLAGMVGLSEKASKLSWLRPNWTDLGAYETQLQAQNRIDVHKATEEKTEAGKKELDLRNHRAKIVKTDYIKYP